MHLGQLIRWSRSVVEGLRSSPRRVWWTTLVLVTCLCGLWGLADPLFAGPDEPAHVIRAVGLDHGQLIGREASVRLRQESSIKGGNLVVRAPAIYRSVGTPCFAFQPDVTAACLQFAGSSRDADVVTSAGRHPPAYYAVVGLMSLVYRPGSGTVYLMRLITALLTGAFIATAVTALLRTAMPRLLAVGLLLGITPMVLFVSSLVNPSAPEIASSLAVWVCGLVLVSQAHERVDNHLVTAVGIAACVLALSRSLGPLWLGLIALIMLLNSVNRESLRNLARSHWARLWAALIVVCCIAQVAWNLTVQPLDYTRSGNARLDIPMSEIVRATLGASFSRYREMIGLFGWQDTPSPVLTYLVWTAGIGLLFFLAIAWSKRRQVAALLALLAITIIVPVVLESGAFRDAGGPAWQGRYTLPVAVGIPILATMALASTERGRQLAQTRLFLCLGAALAIAQFLAFTQNLRRYTVGYDAELQYWKHPQWSPPLSSLPLTIIFGIVIVVFVLWMLHFDQRLDDAVGPH